ncbi:MAG: L,D-transpeptidase [Bacillota bacterium]
MGKKILSCIIIVLFFISCLHTGEMAEKTWDKIVINIPSRTLTFYKNDTIEKTYPIAVGNPKTQTPTGSYSILNKVVNPYYRKKNIPGGSPNNPLGIRWMAFKPAYGIHGNSNPSSIGTAVSGGCIRMLTYDVVELYDNVNVKTAVEVLYNVIDLVGNDNKKGLVIYPDIYRKEKQLSNHIREHLAQRQINIENRDQKILEVIKSSKSKTAVLSEGWSVILNNYFIIVDTKIGEDGVYISSQSVEEYFGLPLEIGSDNKYTYMGNIIDFIMEDEKVYFSINDIYQALGGEIQSNEIIQNVWYDLQIVKLNGVFLQTNQSKFAVHSLKIPIEQVANILGGQELITDKVINIGKERYMELHDVKELFGLTTDIRSIDKRIELFRKPDVYLDQKKISATMENGRIKVSLVELGLASDAYYNNTVFLDDLKDAFDIHWNTYKTEIALKEKIIPVEQNDNSLPEKDENTTQDILNEGTVAY